MHNVLIRPLVSADSEVSWKWRNDSLVWSQTGGKPNIYVTPQIEKEWIEQAISEETSSRFAIIVDDHYVGNVQLTNITPTEGVFHIFIGSRSYWGRGIGNLATYQILYYAKEILHLERISLEVKSSHTVAIAVYERNGFVTTREEGGLTYMTCQLSSLKRPMVSIFCMVYNHADYIEDALKGFLMQKVNFNYEIVIGDDFSSDASRNIIDSYANRYPGKFKLIYHNQNVGARCNQRAVFDNCSGRYIALCEGDDFWISPEKLQKQIDFLEKNTEFAGVFHPAKQINVDTGEIKVRNLYPNYKPSDFSFEKVLNLGGGFFPTAAMVIRRKVIENSGMDIWNHSTGDYPLGLLIAHYGKIGYMSNVMTVYRVQSHSVSNSLYPSISDCKRAVLDKYILNTTYIEVLARHFGVDGKVSKSLQQKENYILLAKYVDCGCYLCSVMGIFKYNLGFKLLFRLLVKGAFVFIKSRGRGNKVRR